MYVCMYSCMICMYVCMYGRIRACMTICANVCLHTSMYSICACGFIMCLYEHVCMYMMSQICLCMTSQRTIIPDFMMRHKFSHHHVFSRPEFLFKATLKDTRARTYVCHKLVECTQTSTSVHTRRQHIFLAREDNLHHEMRPYMCVSLSDCSHNV